MTLDTPIPTRLGDIIQRNRDRIAIDLATPAERAGVARNADIAGPPKRELHGWCVIAIRELARHQASLHVLGYADAGHAWITSQVIEISPDERRVRTKNSIYGLAAPLAGEPDIELVLFAAHMLRRWGVDQAYDLGVIDVFY